MDGQIFPMPVPGGNVTGPASSTDGDLAQFDGTSGQKLKDGGLKLDVDGALAANSDTRVPSQKAGKTYADGHLAGTAADPTGLADKFLWIYNAGAGQWKPRLLVAGDIPAGASTPYMVAAVDTPPVSPDAMDDEFNAGSLDAKWTVWASEAGITRTYLKSCAYIINDASARMSWFHQPVPAGSWEFRCRYGGTYRATLDFYAGIYVANATGAGIFLETGNSGQFYVATRGPSIATGRTTVVGPTSFGNMQSLYQRLTWDGSDTLKFYLSNDGVGWWLVYTCTWSTVDSAFLAGTAPSLIGPAGNHQATPQLGFYVDWFRRIA